LLVNCLIVGRVAIIEKIASGYINFLSPGITVIYSKSIRFSNTTLLANSKIIATTPKVSPTASTALAASTTITGTGNTQQILKKNFVGLHY
jgi:hypothetical protein